MNYLDILLLIPTAWWLFRGFSKGLIMSLASLAGLIAGIYFAVHFSDLVSDWLIHTMKWQPRFLPQIAFSITFLLAVIVIQILGRIFNKAADMASLGILNRLGGAALGLAKAAVFLGAILFIINSVDVNQQIINPDTRKESKLYGPLSAVFPYIWPKIKPLLPVKEKPQAQPGAIV